MSLSTEVTKSVAYSLYEDFVKSREFTSSTPKSTWQEWEEHLATRSNVVAGLGYDHSSGVITDPAALAIACAWEVLSEAHEEQFEALQEGRTINWDVVFSEISRYFPHVIAGQLKEEGHEDDAIDAAIGICGNPGESLGHAA